MTDLVAIESAFFSADSSLETWPFQSMGSSAIAAGFEQFLLMGIGAADDAETARLDQAIRGRLEACRLPYAVLYGSLHDRLSQVLAIIDTGLSRRSQGTPEAPAHRVTKQRGWSWACDTCSDPQCEHRLLTDLVSGRRAAAEANAGASL